MPPRNHPKKSIWKAKKKEQKILKPQVCGITTNIGL